MKEMKMQDWESEMEEEFDNMVWEVGLDTKVKGDYEKEIINRIAKKFGKDILDTEIFDEWYTDICDEI